MCFMVRFFCDVFPQFLVSHCSDCWQLTPAVLCLFVFVFAFVFDVYVFVWHEMCLPLCVCLSWDVIVRMCLFVIQHPQILDSMASHCSDCWQLTPAPLCLSIQALPGLCSLQSRCFEIFQNISRDEMMISKGLNRLQSRYFQKRGEMVPGNNPKYILTSKITQGPIIIT